MNHGYDDDDEDDYNYQPPPAPQPPRGMPSGILAQLMGGWGGGYGIPARADAYDEYFKAYSVAVMDRKERPELLYGGKIIMPPSALAKLSALDIEGPWTFSLRNPRNPNVKKTHAGVLEFIAEEGMVHLPAWMMKTLDLNEGDPIRLSGTVLPKGKLVKIQAQSTDFLQVSDAKAVLESALRFYSVLSKNDIIEITYNNLTFEFLIINTLPEGPGISIIDTDLEVDFETPVGYVEPPRPVAAPIPTMADKLKIDLGETASASAGSSRSESRASQRVVSEGSTSLESFTGYGQSLSGKRVKGKGLSKKIEELEGSKAGRADGPRIITPDSFTDNIQVPVALKLPAGKFFFGYKYIPFDPAKAAKSPTEAAAPTTLQPFSGNGQTMRSGGPSSSSSAQVKAGPSPTTAGGASGGASGSGTTGTDPWAKFGSGNTLSTASASAKRKATAEVEVETSSAPSSQREKEREMSRQEVIDATMLDEDDFFQAEEDGWEGDDVIEIDSD